ncbi:MULTISPECIES: iron-containing alcohol dehydrogenase [Clostridium]|uniref:1,3-propanediol dehydrogenase n=3 Tax=Clostridium TaxID=1485 RepID=D8GT35_CLOLD|nr:MULTISPECIES: iron-containing alcohol dehydrogenase [Clostridium]ADK16634.1 1,3-propanediol dehydrogenase [Clostridium ljungdahlii DSM 13528]AGY75725.1 iron-containing alcohol dehydrogenase [Clostridium autoethanogenum DSM 10061]ALU35889.1 Alcohol dehydrogenase [Clostridium autoethanogenum DSM 10061]OAA89497.1 1,3-propanediol dehydrogenase [Clostridium ljungdahlii DSM 13528]OVY52052.1 1,3-propanediol dehydrogenase [Clostridium autoethanogenum]
MDYSVFQCPKKIIYGKDTVNFIGSEAAVFGNKAMIVTGKHSSKKTGALDKVYYSLKDQGIDPVIFNKVESDPSVITVREGVKAGKKEKVDFIVALGGGSAMDAAKAISMAIGNGGDILDYEKVQPKTYGIPIIAVPTTAGTGSEVSKFSIITDTERKIKMLISSNFIIPEVAILDPLLTMMMPPQVTAATGMDAFTHAIEAYISKAAQPMSDTFAIKAIKIISSNISRSVLKGDIEAREKMLLGQMYAGLAFSNASTALVHSMSRPLGAYYKVPHGMANAILLTEVMKFNRASCAERFKVIAEAMGENVEGKSVREASLIAVDTIKSIFLETGLPVSLKEVGVDKDNFRKMAEDAMESKTTALNPRKPTVEQLVEIYEKIY